MRSIVGVEVLGSAVDALGSVDLSGLADGEVRELVLGLWRESCRVQAQLTRLVGLTQKLGDTWLVELSDTSTLPATSFWFRPIWFAMMRSTVRRKSGWSVIC